MTAIRQFSRYVAIGVGTNATLYGAYLALTALGLRPTIAMTLVYVTGTISSFYLNRRWAFQSTQPYGNALARYVLLYASGYILNYAGLAHLPVMLRLPHQLVQICLMGGLVVYFFLMLRLWVFRQPSLQATAPEA